ncbi:MAG TPA: ABC transporter substrate-binding protein [Chloroflexota bacterium]|nr:ABC transporter substrate-binding protein [Chloroflexota bacterium]
MRGSSVFRWLLVGGALALSACGSGASAPGGSAAVPAAPPAAAGSAPAAQLPAAPTAAATAPANLTHARFGSQLVAGDVALFVADDLGYFQQHGIDFELVPFSSASEMIPALATDQLEVGSLAANPAGFNAIARGVPIKSVLDKGSFPPGQGDQALAIRKEVYDAGRGHTLSDLKGLNIGFTPPGKGTTSACALSAGMQRAGASLDELVIQPLNFPDMVPALANGAIDGAMITEPFLTRAVQQGSAVRVMGIDQMYPNFQISTLGFAPSFIANRPAAKGFAAAYILASRAYIDAVAGRPSPITRARIDELIAEHTKIDAATVHEMGLPGLNPNGLPNKDAMMYCYQFFRDQGLIPEPVTDAQFASLWATDLVNEVLDEIGRVPE